MFIVVFWLKEKVFVSFHWEMKHHGLENNRKVILLGEKYAEGYW